AIAMRDPVTNRPMVRRAGNPNTTMSGLAWLSFNTSFSGKDSLVTKISAGNGNSPINQLLSAGLFNTAGTPFFDQTAGVFPNEFVLHELFYSFPVTDNLRVTVGPRVNWFLHFDFNPFTLPFTGANTFNAINSSFLTSTKRGAGAVVEWNISKNFEFRTGYLVENTEFIPGVRPAADPNRGLFNGADTITAELTVKPAPTANIRFLYQRSNLARNFAGQISAQPILGVADDGFGGRVHDATADTFGVNFDWLITKGFGIFGRYYYSITNIDPIDPARSGGNINAQNIQAGLAFPDLVKRGALATVSFVIPFDVLEGRRFLVAGGGNGGTQYEIGATYFFPLSQNIGIVPSLYVIGNINNFDDNPTVFVGNLQTEFRF
ncbi:MAG: iron uptake porin, partial [Phormidium sp.]